jgi:hypothetical protein
MFPNLVIREQQQMDSSSLSYLIFGNCCLNRVLERLIELTCVLPAERPASMILALHSREFLTHEQAS